MIRFKASHTITVKSQGMKDMEKSSTRFVFKLTGGCVIMALALIGTGELVIYNDVRHEQTRIIVILAALIASLYIFSQQLRMRSRQQEIAELNARLVKVTHEDELTGLGNRRSGMKILENQIQQAERYNCPLSIAIIDVDRFKQVNDRYGHPAGDKLLRHLASGLKHAVRKSDMVFRLGGDEFMMVFPQTDLEQVLNPVGNIFQYFKVHPCRLKDAVLPISLSIGLAESRADESVDALLHRADIKLYQAKAVGRNGFKY